MHRRALALGIGIAGSCLVALYLFGSMGLAGNARIAAYNSGIFDMDSDRVIFDWTSEERGLRTPVHPLVKLFMAPTVAAVRAVGGPVAGALNAVLVVVALSMALNAILCGWLAGQLSGGRLLPAAVTVLLTGVSFSSILLGSIPETASVSALSTVAPLLYLNRRIGRRFGFVESLVWGALGVFCIAFTLTQVVHWAIALGCRAVFATRASAGDSERSVTPLLRHALRIAPRRQVGVLVVSFVVATAALAQLQGALYRGGPVFYTDPGIAHERHYMRFDDIATAPLSHALRLASQFFLYDFAAPRPGFSSMLSFVRGDPYWSISLEESHPQKWALHQFFLIAAVGVAVCLGLWALRRMDRRFVAPSLCVVYQLVLHFAYGREYVLYSGNWHGVLVALLVASVFVRFESRQILCALISAALGLAMLANNLSVLHWVYGQVEHGLEARLRDLDGELLVDPPPGIRPRGARVWP